MATRISIQHEEFKKRTEGILDACGHLTTTAKDVPTRNSCKGIKLQEYVNEVTNIANLIWKYQRLLMTDVNDIVKSAETIEQADREAGNNWKVITRK